MQRFLGLIAFIPIFMLAALGHAQERPPAGGFGASGPSMGPSSGAPTTTMPTITNRGQIVPPRDRTDAQRELTQREPTVPPEPPTEFQEFVATSTGQYLPLFGYNLFSGTPSTFAPLDHVPVTPDYVLGPGDEIVIRAWGQVDIDYRSVVDRNGAIHIPQVGTLNVGGLRYQDLHNFIRSHISRIFKNFDLSVMLGQLRSVQIFVVGNAKRPGAYTVSSLSTLVNGLFASGGPSTKGSLRRIQLKRGAQVVTEFDVYDLIARGDKSRDARLLPGDVIYIPPVGPLVAISGSVNQPAVYELKGETSVGELIQLAGSLTATARGQKATIERIDQRRARQVTEIALDKTGLARPLHDGDLIQVKAISPRFENAVVLSGAVANAGRYPWREGMRVRDVIPDRQALIVPEYWERLNVRATLEAERARLDIIRSREEARLAALREERDMREGLLGRDTGRGQQARDTARAQQGRANPRARGNATAGGSEPDTFKNSDELRLQDELRRRADGVERMPITVRRTFDEINWDYAVIERLNYDDLTTMLVPFNLGRAVIEGDPNHNLTLRPGDVITVFSKADIQVPSAKQTKFVKLEGELVAPGVYQILPGETLRQLVTRVGGVTANSYLYGAEFTREAVRIQQQRRLDEALNRLSQEVERAAAAKATSGLETDAAGAAAQAESQRRLVERLREIKATGRIVLDMPQQRSELASLPELALEDGDQFLIPAKPSTVGVIGAVFNQNTFIYDSSKRVSDYLQLAGGTTRDADTGRIYIVRADGSVTGKAQGSFFNVFASERMMPGDTVVVPENLERFRLTKELKDWSQIFYQFALGVAGLKVLKDL
jgi:polysaccharide biosynthesis/export protein